MQQNLMEYIFALQQLSSTEGNLLKYRFKNAHTLFQELKKYMHALYKPVSKEFVEVHEFSSSHTIRQERVTTGVTLLDNIPTQKDISG